MKVMPTRDLTEQGRNQDGETVGKGDPAEETADFVERLSTIESSTCLRN